MSPSTACPRKTSSAASRAWSRRTRTKISEAYSSPPRGQAMLDWSKCRAVERIPGKVSGAWLFKGTRVPVLALFENLEGGATIDEFLEWFPGVTREQVEQVLRHAEDSLTVA